MEQLRFRIEDAEGALPRWECGWKIPKIDSKNLDTELRSFKGFSGYNPDGYSLCERCDGTGECAERLKCDNYKNASEVEE